MSAPITLLGSGSQTRTFERGIHNDQYSYNVDDLFYIDATQLAVYAAVLDGAPAIVNQELQIAMGMGVTDLEQAIVSLMPRGNTGALGRSTRRLVHNDGLNISGEVRSLASIAPHNVFVDQGHGAIRPRRRKWLHFYVGGIRGREVFSKYSPPKAGVYFMRRGFERARSSIERRIDDATGRVVLRLSQ